MNWKRGLFRLWVIASIGWVASVFVAADVPDRVHYAWRYYTDYNRVQKEQAIYSEPGPDRYLDPTQNRWDLAAAATLAGEDLAELSKPEKPEWLWLAVLLLPPTLGVAVACGLLLAVFKTGRWIYLGFKR